MTAEDDDNNKWRRVIPGEGTILKVLTGVQYTSGLIFSIFVGVHLVAPIAAAFGGVSAGDKAMLLTREYYQSYENLVVYLPLGLHISSSLLKRLLITSQTHKFPTPTIITITGYTLLGMIPIHILTNRIIPQSSIPPISGLSPSELGFDFVAWGIRYRLTSSSIAYLGIVGVIVPHIWIGLGKIMPWLRRTLGIKRTAGSIHRGMMRNGRKGMWGLTVGLLSLVVVMIARLYSEGEAVSPWLAKRFEAVHLATPWEKMGMIL